MKNLGPTAYCLTLLLALASSACQTSGADRARANPARAILDRAVEAHGGLEAWQKLRALSYTKETRLYREDGSVEDSTLQAHTFRWSPAGRQAILEWTGQGVAHRIEHDGRGTAYWLDDVPVEDSARLASARRQAEAAWYTISQPFNLRPDSAYARYEGMDTLSDGTPVQVVRMDYPGPDADTWWYFFDPVSGRCLANLVRHRPTHAWIENLAFDTSTPLLLHRDRQTWRVDSLRRRQYLRASYRYRDHDVILDE